MVSIVRAPTSHGLIILAFTPEELCIINDITEYFPIKNQPINYLRDIVESLDGSTLTEESAAKVVDNLVKFAEQTGTETHDHDTETVFQTISAIESVYRLFGK